MKGRRPAQSKTRRLPQGWSYALKDARLILAVVERVRADTSRSKERRRLIVKELVQAAKIIMTGPRESRET